MNPFSRSVAMFAAIASIMSTCWGDTVRQQHELAKLGPYESRGKGGRRAHRPSGVAAVRRAAAKRRRVVAARKQARGRKS